MRRWHRGVNAVSYLFETYAGDYHRLFLGDVNGVVWASNSHWLVPVPDRDHPIAKLLALYNLPLAPCVVDVDETLTLSDAAVPEKITELVQSVPDDLEPLTRHCLNGEPLYAFDGDQALALFELPGGRFVATKERYRKLVEDASFGEWHGGPDPTKPVYLRSDGRTTGLLMGVRCRASENQAVPTTTGA